MADAIYLTKVQMITEKSKHIDIRYHFIRDIIDKGLVKVCKISTDNNPADMMTKHVSVAKFELCSILASEAEARRREAWAGAQRCQLAFPRPRDAWGCGGGGAPRGTDRFPTRFRVSPL